MSQNRHKIGLVVALSALAFLAHAQQGSNDLEFSASPSPVGAGARAAGMADAFVAIADDATAASWNPAGLVQLERPELSVVGSYNGLWEEFDAPRHSELEGWNDSHNLDLNYFSFAYPLPFLVMGRNATVSLNYHRKYDFSRKLNLDLNLAYFAAGGGVPVNELFKLDFEQKGGIGAITPAFAIELNQRLSIGASVNFWRSSFLGQNTWEQKTKFEILSQVGTNTSYSFFESKERYEDLSGENLVLGLLWNVADRWSVGARYDTAFTGRANYKRKGWQSQMGLATGNLNIAGGPWREPRDIRFPESIALGAACRVNDRLTLSCDVTRTDWEDFWYKGRDGNHISLVNGQSFDTVLFKPDIDPTYTVRFGGEYVCIPKQLDEQLNRLWTLRAGLFYDQEPASGHPDDFYGLAAGVGLLANQRVNIDLAYQLRYGHEVNGDFIRVSNRPSEAVPHITEDVFQHRIVLSTVIYF